MSFRSITAVVAGILLTSCAAKPAATPVADPAGPAARTPTAAGSIEAQVVGSWKVEAGGDFEEITLAADGTWSSFLHARPMYSGNWVIDGRKLRLNTGDVDEPLAIDDVSIEGNELRGTFWGKPARWTRM